MRVMSLPVLLLLVAQSPLPISSLLHDGMQLDAEGVCALPGLELVGKLQWLHVPKTGTSFINVLLTWGCTDLADDFIVTKMHRTEVFFETYQSQCKGLDICEGFFRGPKGYGHLAVRVSPCMSGRAGGNSFVGMFRQPEDRHISEYYMLAHREDFYQGNTEFFVNMTLLEYAKLRQGLYVNMLAGHATVAEATGNATYGINTSRLERLTGPAADTLRSEFAFVGITESWALSVCAFHAALGGCCHAREFIDVNPGANRSGHVSYNKSELHGWTDIYDHKVYATALDIFQETLSANGVTSGACRDAVCTSVPDVDFGWQLEVAD